MAGPFSFIAALLVFGGWMSIVGNPHVAETVIGLVLALVVWAWTYRKLKKLGSRFNKA